VENSQDCECGVKAVEIRQTKTPALAVFSASDPTLKTLLATRLYNDFDIGARDDKSIARGVSESR